MRLKSCSVGGSSANPFSQVEVIQTNWLEVCNFFAQVQCTENEKEMNKLSAELPTIEGHLDFIIEELSKERKEWLQGGVAHAYQSQAQAWHPSVADSTTRGQIAESSTSPTVSRCASQGLSTGELLTSPEAHPKDLQDLNTTLFLLPPCYFYLFGDFALHLPYDEDPHPLLEKDRTGEAHAVDSPTRGTDDGGGVEGDLVVAFSSPPPPSAREGSGGGGASAPLTIGPLFLLTLCMYAKHNQPVGARLVILRFLTRLLCEVDVPPGLRAQYAHLYPANAPRSVLQITPSASIVPLLDMLRCVGRELDPARAPPSPPPLSSTAERLEFVRFLCALAERVERVPGLANFFTTTADAASETFELLRALLPYLVLDGAGADGGRRAETARLALAAVAALARCADPWVQGLVGAEPAVAARTLSAACHALITLCKIPGDEDGPGQRRYLADVLRFWAGLAVAAPAVAARLRLLEQVERDFVRAALVPLLRSPDRVVYAAACLLAAAMLDELSSSAPALGELFGRALLAAVVDANTGRVCADASDYYAHWASARETGRAAGSHTSFFNFYILPHLTATPALSDERRSNWDSGKLAFTEWTATEASLVLVKSLAENLPVIFLKYVLLLDVGTLGDVWGRFGSGHAGRHGEGGKRTRGLLATTFTPLIEMNDCFPTHLRAANKRVCGVTDEELAKEVLERMLRIESNAPLSYLHQRQLVEGFFFQEFYDSLVSPSVPEDDLPSERHDTGELPSTIADEADGDASCTFVKNALASEVAADAGKAPNAWFHEGPHQAPVIVSLTRILLKLFDLPYRVNILLTQTLITICLLPDLRALYTFMDSDQGRLYHSLRMLRDSIDKLLDGDNKASLVMAHAMAATSECKETGKPRRRTSSDGGHGPDVDTKSLASTSLPEVPEFPTLIYLYNIYLNHWDCLSSPALWDCDDLCGYRALNHPLPESLPEEICKGLIKNKSFLETCAVLEMFRLELSAVVGYMTLSHSLLNLQPGKIRGMD